MKQDISKLLLKKKKQILEDWMTMQLADAGLREDLMSNEELREQSSELLETLLKVINEKTYRIPIQKILLQSTKYCPASPYRAHARDFHHVRLASIYSA